jgi:hypothetical protein
MSKHTTAKDIIRKMLETLRESAKEQMPNATEAEREASIVSFLGGASDEMFEGPSGQQSLS